jgi:hypothetical protein
MNEQLDKRVMEAVELSALGHVLCDIPDGKTYEEIVDALVEAGEEAPPYEVWQPFEHYDGQAVADLIEDERLVLISLVTKVLKI